MIELSIIIVSWNVKDFLHQLIDSIFQFTEGVEYEIVVVDNNSSDDTARFLQNEYRHFVGDEKLRIIANNFNAGFAKANNQGLKIAKGKYILFMNPDMELIENSFLDLTKFMDQSPDVGVCTCQLLYGDNTIQPNIKDEPTFLSQLLILLKFHHALRGLSCLKKYFRSDFDYSRIQYVSQVMGAFIFTRKEVMDKIGNWDEDYWLWWEDVELCYDIKAAGFEIVYLPITKVIHYEGKSFGQTRGWQKQKRFNRGMILYFKKRGKHLITFIFWILQPVSFILTAITTIFRVKPASQSKLTKQN
ncbi:glycosyltransferase family 2 protein [Candidatus Falkowbacteria bacterium]|nr:glycosyltransferase family 2 protein [Candidatus Falkowbacteria bacterium]